MTTHSDLPVSGPALDDLYDTIRAGIYADDRQTMAEASEAVDALDALVAALHVAEQERDNAVKDFALHLTGYSTPIQREKLPSIVHTYLASRSPQSETPTPTET